MSSELQWPPVRGVDSLRRARFAAVAGSLTATPDFRDTLLSVSSLASWHGLSYELRKVANNKWSQEFGVERRDTASLPGTVRLSLNLRLLISHNHNLETETQQGGKSQSEEGLSSVVKGLMSNDSLMG